VKRSGDHYLLKRCLRIRLAGIIRKQCETPVNPVEICGITYWYCRRNMWLLWFKKKNHIVTIGHNRKAHRNFTILISDFTCDPPSFESVEISGQALLFKAINHGDTACPGKRESKRRYTEN
jgi:hypothetical protein